MQQDIFCSIIPTNIHDIHVNKNIAACRKRRVFSLGTNQKNRWAGCHICCENTHCGLVLPGQILFTGWKLITNIWSRCPWIINRSYFGFDVALLHIRNVPSLAKFCPTGTGGCIFFLQMWPPTHIGWHLLFD